MPVCVKGSSEHPEIVTVLERKVDILPVAQPAHGTTTSFDSSDTDLGSSNSKPFTALKDRFLQVCNSCLYTFLFAVLAIRTAHSMIS